MGMMEGIGGARTAISIWNVYLPSEVDRNKYVTNCLRTGTVTLINTNNEVVHKIPIGKLALQLVKFPAEQPAKGPAVEPRLGSVVSCGNVLGHNQMFVLDVYNYENEFNHIEENEFRLIKEDGVNKAEVSLRGKKGIASVSVHSDDADGGQLHINVTHSDGESALVKLSVSGDIDVEATGSVSVKSSSGLLMDVYDGNEDEKRTTLKYTALEGLSYSDEFGNSLSLVEGVLDFIGMLDEENGEFNQIKADAESIFVTSQGAINLLSNGEVINLGDGAEKMVLGDTLAQLLKDLITEISIATTPAGPLGNAASIAAFVAKVDNILSTYSNTQ